MMTVFIAVDKITKENSCLQVNKHTGGIIRNITKTRLFKYMENVTSQNWKFSDKNSDIFRFLLKT